MSNNRIALDVHAHQIPLVPDRIDGIEGVALDDGALVIDGHRVGIKALYRPDLLIEWMDRYGVDRALVSAPPPTYRPHLTNEQARNWTSYLNDGLRTVCDQHSDRLSVALHIPANRPAVAAETAQQAADAGARHFSMPAGPAGDLTLSDTAYDRLWAVLDRIGAFVFVHPGACCDGRLKAFYLENLLGNPYETAVAAAHLVFGGVLDRYPRIRFCLAHGGGASAALAGRWQRGFETVRPGIDPRVSAPRSALARFYVDSIVHDADALTLVARVFGHDRILFGSDWPFPMGLPKPSEQLQQVSGEMRQQVGIDNAASLLSELNS